MKAKLEARPEPDPNSKPKRKGKNLKLKLRSTTAAQSLIHPVLVEGLSICSECTSLRDQRCHISPYRYRQPPPNPPARAPAPEKKHSQHWSEPRPKNHSPPPSNTTALPAPKTHENPLGPGRNTPTPRATPPCTLWGGRRKSQIMRHCGSSHIHATAPLQPSPPQGRRRGGDTSSATPGGLSVWLCMTPAPGTPPS